MPVSMSRYSALKRKGFGEGWGMDVDGCVLLLLFSASSLADTHLVIHADPSHQIKPNALYQNRAQKNAKTRHPPVCR